jgi:putative transposase
MPRIARAVAVGFPHHIVQRGNNGEGVFFEDRDKRKYLSLLKNYSEKWRSPVIAYCLMSNHVHLLTRPAGAESLSKMMQGVTLCYTQYVNKTCKRRGRLWESRYYSSIIDEAAYLWAAARYIEQNPRRAGLVERDEDFPYSSAKAHITGSHDDVLGDELFEAHERRGYGEFVKARIPGEEIDGIRYSTKTGRPLGSEQFMRQMEGSLGRPFLLRPSGRPRKREGG